MCYLRALGGAGDGWCCSSRRSRWAQFQYDCQPSEENAGGCKQENYGACLLSYTGLMGERCPASTYTSTYTYTYTSTSTSVGGHGPQNQCENSRRIRAGLRVQDRD